LPFIGEALLDWNAVQQFPLPPHPNTTRGFPAAAPFPTNAAVNMDKLRQLKYRQRAKNSLSILTEPRSLLLLAYRRAAM
jgi:hypothetical protein